MSRADELATPGLMRSRRCAECTRTFSEPARPCQPRLTCSDACRKLRIRRQKRDEKRRRTRREHVELLRFLPPEGRGNSELRVTPAELAELLELHGKGWAVAALATRFDVTPRTIYRYLRFGRPEYVKVGRYGAWFAPQQEGPPVQLTEWAREKAMDAQLHELEETG